MIGLLCKHCNNRLKTNRNRFCNKECFAEYRLKRQICIQCNKNKCKDARSKFCSRKCYGLFQRGKSLDRITPSKKGYIRIVKKDSPLADKQGKVLLHRQVFYENKDVLFSDEIVHHIDENKRNNSPENLQKLRRDEHTPHTHKEWKQASFYDDCPFIV